jgi:hypothetical protein
MYSHPTLPVMRSAGVANPPPLGPRSVTLIAFLHRTPRFLLILGVLALLLGGLFVPGLPGALLLLVVAALAGWLAWLTWANQSPVTRALRLLVVAGMVAVAVDKVL